MSNALAAILWICSTSSNQHPKPCSWATLYPAARKGVPRGRPLRTDELVEVIWTIDPPEQYENGATSKAIARQERLRQLCNEAAAQGAEPTVGDLASALGVTARTVDRDIATLRAAGEVLLTRGSSG